MTSPTYQLPPIETITQIPTNSQTTVLDALFEPSTALHILSLDLLKTTTFQSYNHLITSIGAQLTKLSESTSSTDIERLDQILGAHPRLGSKKVESTQSQQEQAQLNSGGDNEAKKLKALNDEYEATFPGLIYVVFVNGRGRAEIMANMRQRIDRGNIRLEREESIKVKRQALSFVAIKDVCVVLILNTFKAMCDIAASRAAKLQTI